MLCSHVPTAAASDSELHSNTCMCIPWHLRKAAKELFLKVHAWLLSGVTVHGGTFQTAGPVTAHVLPALVDTCMFFVGDLACAARRIIGGKVRAHPGAAILVAAWLGAAFVPRGACGCVLYNVASWPWHARFPDTMQDMLQGFSCGWLDHPMIPWRSARTVRTDSSFLAL